MIRNIGESVGEAVAEGVGRMVGLAQEQRPLPADLLEAEDSYLVVFDAPGAEPGDVQARYEDGTVHVRVDRFRAYHEGFDMLFPGRGLALGGRKRLPPDAVVDADAATATLRSNGTLAIELPKGDPAALEPGQSAEVADDETASGTEPAAETGDDSSEATDTDG